MSHEAAGHTLQPAALVHEAWLRLADRDTGAQFQNRTHFFAAADMELADRNFIPRPPARFYRPVELA